MPNVQENEEYVLVGTHNASIISEHLLIPALGLSFKINNDDDAFKKGFFKLTIQRNMETTVVSIIDLEPLIQEMSWRMEYLENSLLLRTAKLSNMCEAFQ